MTIRLVSFLGLGPPDKAAPFYTEATYTLEPDFESTRTPLVQRAHLDILRLRGEEDIRVVLLGTKQVAKRWIEGHECVAATLLEHPFELRVVKAGATAAERWAVFRAVTALLSSARLDSEVEPPSRIILDVTHGFRLQPMMGLAAASFVRADETRRGVASVPLDIFYGAYEPGKPSAPLWRLTEFVRAAEWSSAFDALLRYGRADSLESLCTAEAKDAVASARQAGADQHTVARSSKLLKLGEAVRELADDIALNRAPNILRRSAPALARRLADDEVRAFWDERLPVLGNALAEIRAWLAPLVAECVVSDKGLRACLELAQRQLKLERFAEAAATLREALVTAKGLELGLACPEPGTPGFDAARLPIDAAWGEATRVRGTESHKLSSRLSQTRNDIEHASFNEHPSSAQRLRDSLGDQVVAAERLIGIAPRSAPRPTAPTCFVNLSNHLTSAWPEPQHAAAQALGYGPPTDLPEPMPVVPPHARSDEVGAIADRLVAMALALTPGAVAVFGEPSLTYALVTRFEARGIPCFAPTTDRRVTATTEGATVQRTSLFEFVQWRRYG